MTRHEKIGLMCTKYISLHYSTYHTFCTSYMSSVSCIKFPIVCCISDKNFIDKLRMFREKVMKLQSSKSGQFYVHISPIFSCRVTYVVGYIWSRNFVDWTIDTLNFKEFNFCRSGVIEYPKIKTLQKLPNSYTVPMSRFAKWQQTCY